MSRPGSDPAPATASVSMTLALVQRARDRLGSRAELVDRCGGHAPERDRGDIAFEIRARDLLHPRERRLVGADRARERVGLAPIHEVAAADDHAGLRSAEQLVAGEGDERGTGLEALARAGFVVQPFGSSRQPRRALVEETRTGIDDHRRPERRELRHRRGRHEADHPVVRRVDLQQERGAFGERALVVGRARAVGRAHLDEPRAGLGHDLGHAETAADLDQFTARDDDLSVARQRGQHEQHRGRVVVDDDAGFGAARGREEMAGVFVTRAADAFGQPVLEIGRTRSRRHRRDRVGPERRAPEVGVQEHAGRVDHRAEQLRFQRSHARLGVTDDIVGLHGLSEFHAFARGVDGRARDLRAQRVWHVGLER